MWAARRFCGVTLRELDDAIGAEYAAVSVAIKRFERRAASARPLRAMQAQLVSMLNVAP